MSSILQHIFGIVNRNNNFSRQTKQESQKKKGLLQ